MCTFSYASITGLLIGLVLLVATVWATHAHWISHYTDAVDTPCCGLRDCIQVHLRVVASDGSMVTLEIGGQYRFQLHRGSFHPSEDEHDWWCAKIVSEPPSTINTRCAFIAIGT